VIPFCCRTLSIAEKICSISWLAELDSDVEFESSVVESALVPEVVPEPDVLDAVELSAPVVDEELESVVDPVFVDPVLDEVPLELALKSCRTVCTAASICCKRAAKLLLPLELVELAVSELAALDEAVEPLVELAEEPELAVVAAWTPRLEKYWYRLLEPTPRD